MAFEGQTPCERVLTAAATDYENLQFCHFSAIVALEWG
jgi:hypothetical protein